MTYFNTGAQFDLGCKAKDLDPKAKDLGPKAKAMDLSAKAKNLGPKAKDSRCQGQIFHWCFYIDFLMFMFCECFYVCVLFPVLTAFSQFINKWICYCY